jgi:hypothetical protein
VQAGDRFSTCDEIEDGWFCYKKLTNTIYEQNKEIVANETCITEQNLMKYPEL